MTGAEVVVSGLRVRLVAMPAARTVGACLRVAAGSGADPARPWGTAHLTEHVRIAAAGGGPAGSGLHITGRTENAETRFTMAGLAEQSGSIAGALARILDPRHTVRAAVVDAERHAVQLESRAASANPLLLLAPAAAEAAVPDGHLADTARATVDSVDRITARHVDEFTVERYRPRAAVLTLAGPQPHRDRLLETIAAALPPDDPGPAEIRGSAPADRPPLELPPELDGLLVLTLPTAVRDPLSRSVARALTADAGPFATLAARAGHALIGRATITADRHEVVVLCWRDDRSGGPRSALAAALAAARRADQEITGAWRDSVLRDFQEHAFARASPLGRAQSELLPEPLDPVSVPAIPDELRRATRRVRLWRLTTGMLHPETT